MSVAFSGLASGLDTGKLIDQLVAAEKSQANQFTTQQGTLASQKNVVDAMSSALSSLGSFARDLELPSSLQMRTASTSDSHLSVAVSGTAIAATHSVRVEQTATGQVATSRTFATQDPGVVGDGSVQITTGTGTPVTVTYSATDSLGSIASKINDTKTGVAASVLFDGSTYRLVLTSQATGTAGKSTFVDSGDSLGLSDPAHITVPARDAKVMVDGVEVTRSKNVIDDALPGVTITANTAQAATDPDTIVSIGVDTAGLTSKLKTFVSDFNSIAGAIAVQSTYNANASQQSALFGDSTVRQLQMSLSRLATASFGGKTLADLGLTIDRGGMMTLDETKATAAITADPDVIGTFFSTSGFGKAVADLSDLYTQAGNGVLALKSTAITDRSKLLQSQIDQINDNADALQKRLQDQFNALEQAMSQLQSQGSYLAKMLG
jgi:flagellar hook-associated protein 2